MNAKVMLIDYNMGNLFSVENALINIGADVDIIKNVPADIAQYSHAILPGVGSFRDGVKMLRLSGWENALKDKIIGKIPILGICLGMQLFAEYGEEGGGESGLGVIDGRVIKGRLKEGEKSIHIGWNSIENLKKNRLFFDIHNLTDFYFVHSYHFTDTSKEIAKVNYFGGVPASVADVEKNIYGVQFHPEKSGKPGLKLLENFLLIQ